MLEFGVLNELEFELEVLLAWVILFLDPEVTLMVFGVNMSVMFLCPAWVEKLRELVLLNDELLPYPLSGNWAWDL